MSVVTVPHWSRLRHLAPEDRAAYVARLIDSEAWRVDPIFARAVVARDAQLTACGIERKTFRMPRGLGLAFEIEWPWPLTLAEHRRRLGIVRCVS